MMRKNWKTAHPTSLRQALEWSLEYAKQKHNLSVERIAERMGQENHWALYKWVQNGRIPTVLIPTFEHVCGINLVSRWLAATGGKLLVEIPTGRDVGAHDMQELQTSLHATTGALMKFYAGKATAEETLGAIQDSLEQLAWHRGNVHQHAIPLLELGEHQND